MSGYRTAIDIEKLLCWAYRDELVKRQTSSAETIWEHIRDFGGGYGGPKAPGSGSSYLPQRYDHGTPDPDAIAVETAVSGLTDRAFDWSVPDTAEHMLGCYAPLMARRDYLAVGSIRVAALVTMHAAMGTRPDWHFDEPVPHFVPASHGPSRPAIVGERLGHNYYRAGSHCPLRWEPSPVSLAQSRADYAAWHGGLTDLVAVLEPVLKRWAPTGPAAPPAPWRHAEPEKPVHRVGTDKKLKPLPLSYPRPVAGPTGATKPGAAASRPRSIKA